ncbi:MAG TPA: hemolysin III family protein [Cellulomonas sp.]|nr:hemolysin III family protein [Cellulomonas sp.]
MAHTSLSQHAAAAAANVKPRLRGWLHAGMFPLAVAGSIVLVALSPTSSARIANTVFGLTAAMLFGTSAVYHLGNWSPRVTGVLRRLDHSNIFLIIAGTYTPLAVLLLDAHTATVLLWTVWIGAVVGLLARVLWLGAPRWLYTPLYVILGMAAIGYLPQFARADAGGPVIVWLIAGCGVAYVIGAVVYATKWPNPSPRWFGFHEVFHSLTVIGYTCTFVAVTIATLAPR